MWSWSGAGTRPVRRPCSYLSTLLAFISFAEDPTWRGACQSISLHACSTTFCLRTQVTQVHGGDTLESVTIANSLTDEARELRVSALFVMIGADPCTTWLRGTVGLDHKGFVRTGAALIAAGEEPNSIGAALSPFQTDLPGAFAVGDVRSGWVKRVASAVGEGSVVVQAVHQHLASLRQPG